ncbi:hypothetical protein JXB41_06470 [Candidatus Woesearchaeota archaeon]|nr:hypothetical protein [Candidatus Woesearchaeota archaeon]
MAIATELQKGKYFEHKGEVFEVTRKELVNCGTHSHTKLKIFAKALDGKSEKTMTFAHNDKIDIVDVFKKKATVISKTDDNVQIMDSISYETMDADAEQDIIKSINEGDEVIYVNVKNKVLILPKKFN